MHDLITGQMPAMQADAWDFGLTTTEAKKSTLFLDSLVLFSTSKAEGYWSQMDIVLFPPCTFQNGC